MSVHNAVRAPGGAFYSAKIHPAHPPFTPLIINFGFIKAKEICKHSVNPVRYPPCFFDQLKAHLRVGQLSRA